MNPQFWSTTRGKQVRDMAHIRRQKAARLEILTNPKALTTAPTIQRAACVTGITFQSPQCRGKAAGLRARGARMPAPPIHRCRH